MNIVQLTPDMCDLARRYHLLLGFINELDMAITLDDLPAEQRLAKIAELIAVARAHTQETPLLFRADRADDPDLQESMIEPLDDQTMYQKVDQDGAPLGEPYFIPRVVQAPEPDEHPGYILGDDGQFYEAEPSGEALQSLTDDDLLRLGLITRQQIAALEEDR